MTVHRKVFVSYLGNGWAAMLGIAVVPYYLHFLGVEAFGLLGFFVTLQAWLFLLDMGLSTALNREMARFTARQHSAEEIRDLLKTMELVFAGLAAGQCLVVVGMASWLTDDWLKLQSLAHGEVTQAISIMGFAMAFQWMGTLYRNALLGLQQHTLLSIVVAAVATVRAAGSLFILSQVSQKLPAFAAYQCAVSLMEMLVLSVYAKRHLPLGARIPRFELTALKNVRRFAAGLMAITFLSTALTQIDKLLLSKILPLDIYGYFSIALMMASAFSLLIGPIYNVAYPRLAELVASNDERALISDYHRFAQQISVVIIPASVMVCVFSEEIVRLWLQNPEAAGQVSPIISVWIIGTAINGLMHVPYAAQLAHGWVRLSIIINILSVVVLVPALFIFVPLYGAIAAAWIWVALNVGYFLFGLHVMHSKILKMEMWTWYFKDTGYAALVCVVSAASCHWIYTLLNFQERAAIIIYLFLSAALVWISAAISLPIGRELMKSILVAPAMKAIGGK